MLHYDQPLPEKPDPVGDTVGKRLTVIQDGENLRQYDVGIDVMNVVFDCVEGKNCHLEFVFIDDADNVSSIPATLDFMPKDLIPPPNPGQLAAPTLVGED